MTIEREYKQLWEKYENLGWTVDIFGFFVRARLEKQFGDKFREELDRVHLAHFPRRRKIVHDNIPEELVAPVREKWMERTTAYYNCAVGRRAWLDKKLSDLAPAVTLTPTNDTQQVYEANTVPAQGDRKMYRDDHPGYCLHNALVQVGIDVEIGEWPLVKHAAQVIRDKGLVVVDEGEFTWNKGEKAIVVYGNKVDEDGITIAHAIITDDVREYFDQEIWMVVFVERMGK